MAAYAPLQSFMSKRQDGCGTTKQRLLLAAAAMAALATALALTARRQEGQVGAIPAVSHLVRPQSVHIFIVRHGDKMSKYPPCAPGVQSSDAHMCYDEERFGNNPELSDCGRRQAVSVAEKLISSWPLSNSTWVLSSPYARTLQTALPLATRLGADIKVQPLFSEDRQLGGPFQPRHSQPSVDGGEDWARIAAKWDGHYAFPPIPTPEANEEYWHRADAAAKVLVEHARALARSNDDSSRMNAAAVFTHACPSFTLAFGLCSSLFDGSLKRFVDDFVMAPGSEGIAAAGIIHAELDSEGVCRSLQLPNNQVWRESQCGRTVPHQKPYADDAGKYWRPPLEARANAKVDRSGD